MDRARVSRYLLFGLLAVPVVWAMWLVPVPQPTNSSASGGSGSWQLKPLSPPTHPKKLASKLAQRQGWGAPSGGGSGTGGTNGGPGSHHGNGNGHNKSGAHSTILGITSVDDQPQVVLMHKNKVTTYAPGDTLPDGRRIKAINGVQVTLAPPQGKKKGKTQILRLFRYDKSHIGMPKSPDKSGKNAG